MSGFDDFAASMRASRERGDAARMMSDDGVKPEVGHCYTISPDFVCGDRSYTEMVLRVLALNEATAKVEVAAGGEFYGTPVKFLSINERAWYLADHMIEAAS